MEEVNGGGRGKSSSRMLLMSLARSSLDFTSASDSLGHGEWSHHLSHPLDFFSCCGNPLANCVLGLVNHCLSLYRHLAGPMLDLGASVLNDLSRDLLDLSSSVLQVAAGLVGSVQESTCACQNCSEHVSDNVIIPPAEKRHALHNSFKCP